MTLQTTQTALARTGPGAEELPPLQTGPSGTAVPGAGELLAGARSLLSRTSELLPPGFSIARIEATGRELTVVLALPPPMPGKAGLAPDSEEVTRLLLEATLLLPYTALHVLAVDPARPASAPLPLHAYETLRPRIGKPGQAEAEGERPLGTQTITDTPAAPAAPAAPAGALSGKAVYVSAGHGWYYYQTGQRWTTQRGLTHGLIEDFNNAEAVNQYLIEYLRRAGADVFPLRDPAMITAELVLDNGVSGVYAEEGEWFTSAMTGYGGGTYRYAVSAAGSQPSAAATWRAQVGLSGWYPVYAWYVPGSNRVPQARYQVAHGGGSSEATLDQRVHGRTWRYLGTWYLRAGEWVSVTLTNQSSQAGLAVIADAIRLGGGVGSITRGAGSSGKPRWEEAARYWAQYQGAPDSVYDAYATGADSLDDIVARPRYADWENEGSGDDAVYVSWHSNAANGSARGTVSFVYNNDPTPPYDQWKRITGSLELQSAVHDKIIAAIRGGWDAGWYDFGKRQANLGEVREARSMPSVLVEMAFHDNITDAAALREPRFAQLLARSLYQGIVDYYARKDGGTPRYLPEPPQKLVMRNAGGGAIALSWQPPETFALGTPAHPAQRYRVYLSADGFAWDSGRDASGTGIVLGGFAPGQLVFARVAAVNEGGESLPSPVLAVRIGDAPRVVVVHGFDSLDGSMRIVQDGVTRMWLERMNRGNYIVQHAQVIPEPFDSAVRQAVAGGDIALGPYRLVDWFSGMQSAADGVLTAAERAALSSYAASPGRVLVISGANLAASLSEADPLFLREVLGAGLSADSSGSFRVCAAGGSMAATLDLELDDGSGPTYLAKSADALDAQPGSAVALRYDTGAAAGVHKRHATGGDTLALGFPLETVRSTEARYGLMRQALAWLDGGSDPAPAFTPTAFLPALMGGSPQIAAGGCP